MEEFGENDLLKPVITDFGIAKMLPTRQASVAAFKPIRIMAASFRYAAPEVLRAIYSGSNVDWSFVHRPDVLLKGDVYSFAMVLYAILTMRDPWINEQVETFKTKVLENQRPLLPDETNGDCERWIFVIKSCWVQDPLQRPSASEILHILNSKANK